MKKRILSIITILGIGVSFCSADGIYHNPDLGLISVILDGNVEYTLKDKNEGATCYDLSQSCSKGTPVIFADVSCPDGYFLPDLSYHSGFFNSIFNHYGLSSSSSQGTFATNMFFFSPTDGTYGYYWHGLPTSRKGYTVYKSYGGGFQMEVGRGAYSQNSVRCFKSSVVEPVKDLRTVLTGDELPDLTPKFVVNYGNTSYEYEVNDNLSIYLKSPIIQSGSTFTYAGSTGINLFYNNTFDFYSKDKLYLNSMFWYNNNIFTPICL